MTIRSKIADYIFPQCCVSCKKEGSLLCSTCQQTTSLSFSSRQISQSKTQLSHYYFHKHDTQAIVSLLLLAYKYQYQHQAFSYIATLLEKELPFVQEYLTLLKVDCLVPIPLHPRKYAERGFNQAQTVAALFSKACNIPVCQGLKRTIYTKPQAQKSDKKTREKNVHNIFLPTKKLCAYERIMLVDDVVTTGATCFSATKMIEKEVIGVLSLERG